MSCPSSMIGLVLGHRVAVRGGSPRRTWPLAVGDAATRHPPDLADGVVGCGRRVCRVASRETPCASRAASPRPRVGGLGVGQPRLAGVHDERVALAASSSTSSRERYSAVRRVAARVAHEAVGHRLEHGRARRPATPADQLASRRRDRAHVLAVDARAASPKRLGARATIPSPAVESSAGTLIA